MKQNKVSVFKDKDIEVFLDNRTDDELATVDLTVENGSDKGVVLGISKLKIDGITHEIYPMEQKVI